MITQESAAGAAERILSAERERLAELQNARAKPIPTPLRLPGLTELEPRHQAALLREAERNVHRTVTFRIWVAAWLAVIALTWYLAKSGREPVSAVFATVPMLGVLAIRRWFVRRELQRLLASSQPKAQ